MSYVLVNLLVPLALGFLLGRALGALSRKK
jgi:hypothetical protein